VDHRRSVVILWKTDLGTESATWKVSGWRGSRICENQSAEIGNGPMQYLRIMRNVHKQAIRLKTGRVHPRPPECWRIHSTIGRHSHHAHTLIRIDKIRAISISCPEAQATVHTLVDQKRSRSNSWIGQGHIRRGGPFPFILSAGVPCNSSSISSVSRA